MANDRPNIALWIGAILLIFWVSISFFSISDTDGKYSPPPSQPDNHSIQNSGLFDLEQAMDKTAAIIVTITNSPNSNEMTESEKETYEEKYGLGTMTVSEFQNTSFAQSLPPEMLDEFIKPGKPIYYVKNPSDYIKIESHVCDKEEKEEAISMVLEHLNMTREELFYPNNSLHLERADGK